MKYQYPEQRKEIRRQVENSADTHGREQFRQQCEHTVRRQLDEYSHHFHDNHFHVTKPISNALSRIAGSRQSESHQ